MWQQPQKVRSPPILSKPILSTSHFMHAPAIPVNTKPCILIPSRRSPEAAPLPHMIISFSACLCPKYVLEVPAHPCLCFISNACARRPTEACGIHGLCCADRGGGGEDRYAVRQCGRVVWALPSPSSKLGRADWRPFSRICFGGDRGAQCSLGWPGPFLGLFQHYMEQRATAVVVRA